MDLQFTSFEQNTNSSNNTSSQVLRTMMILNLLPNYPHEGYTTTEVFDEVQNLGFKISRKSVERDLKSCFMACPDVESQKSVFDGQIRWYRTTARNNYTVNMSYYEALVFSLCEEKLSELLPLSAKKSLQNKFNAANHIIKNTTNSDRNLN